MQQILNFSAPRKTNKPQRNAPAYAELHCMSNFSFLRGASHPQELMQTAIDHGYHSLAITDECSLAGVVRAYSLIKGKSQQECKTKLIIGSEFRFEEGVVLVLLAKTRKGYGQISELITQSRMRCEKGSYQVWLDDIQDGMSDCIALWRPQHFIHHQGGWAQEQQVQAYQQHLTEQGEIADKLKPFFPESLWILYERLLTQGEDHYAQLCQQLAQQHQLQVTCAGNVHMHHPERKALQDVLTAIDNGLPVSGASHLLLPNGESAMRPREKIAALYPESWIDETVTIAEQCQFCLSELRYEYPSEIVPADMTPMSYLRELVETGKKWRFPDGVPESIHAIIEKEMGLIEEAGYAYFFLTIYDIVQFAKQQNILHQGRGSAANSIVCYCLGITAVDPQKISVLFERFISKERDEPPDIDVDFEHERREEVIQYIYQKYGRSRAALAATVITYRFKSAVREVGKALGIEESQLSYFIKNVDRRDRDIKWQQQLQSLGLDASQHTAHLLVELVQQIMGFPRHLSQHVGGFVISAGPLSQLVPTENASMAERSVIQWDKDDLEVLGLLKVDILALGMLTAVRKCFDMVRQQYQIPMAMEHVVWEDPKVYHMLQKADSIGVFQVESRAQSSMLPRLKPSCYYDLVVQIAIVRPGPIQGDMVHPYLRRRDGKETVHYPSKEVEMVLKRTLGVPIFQEQVIQLAMVAAGFTGGEADQLRRSMASWRRNGTPEKFKAKLIDGMLARGYEQDFAERIYQQICGFGEYGFPESHSASFALLAYVSAWLKCHYPAAFCCALLNSQPMGFYSPSQLVQDVQRHNVEVLPVDINHSDWDHTLVKQTEGTQSTSIRLGIRLGFRLVKGVSRQGIEVLLNAREEVGFTRMAQIVELGLSKTDLSALASANAFSELSGNRYQARWDMAGVEQTLPLFAKAVDEDDNLDKVAEPNPNYQLPFAPSEMQNLVEDYATIGMTLGKHPIAMMREHGILKGCIPAAELNSVAHKRAITVAGVVTGRQRPGTASGVTFMTLEDETGNSNVVIWQGTARAQKQNYLTAKVLKIKGVLEREGDVIHIIAGRLIDLSPELAQLQTSSRDFH